MPEYINEDDKKYFYIISDDNSLEHFINSPMNNKPIRKVYTEFSPETVNNLLQ